MNSLTEFPPSVVAEHLGWDLMHSLWQFMFIAAALFLVRQLSLNRSATVRRAARELSAAGSVCRAPGREGPAV